MVEKLLHKDEEVPRYFTVQEAAMLLSRQHTSVVRLVKKVRQRVLDTVPVGSEQIAEHIGYIGSCDDILAALQQGGKP
jgi:hypothetical protein